MIATERLLLRPFERSDLRDYAAFVADPDVMRFIGGAPLDRDGAVQSLLAWIERYEVDGLGMFALLDGESGKFLGRCGLLVWELPSWQPATLAESTQPTEIEIGWALVKDAWGSGFATEAAGAVVDHAFTRLKLTRLVALIHPDNSRSARVAERIHFEYSGVVDLHGASIDLYAREA